ncbi:MAG: RHS repeat protein, partial [Xanthomonadales bacterium]|nr:RHS repeat protein [Xanthomonadales bacterium]
MKSLFGQMRLAACSFVAVTAVFAGSVIAQVQCGALPQASLSYGGYDNPSDYFEAICQGLPYPGTTGPTGSFHLSVGPDITYSSGGLLQFKAACHREGNGPVCNEQGTTCCPPTSPNSCEVNGHRTELAVLSVNIGNSACPAGSTAVNCGGEMRCRPTSDFLPDQNEPTCPVSNPIDPLLREKYRAETDIADRGDGLGFKRYYRSNMPEGRSDVYVTRDIGANWHHSQSYLIDVEHREPKRRTLTADVLFLQARRPSGRAIQFNRLNGAWQAPNGVKDTLVDRMSGSTHIGWTFTEQRSGNVETYDANGEILHLTMLTGRTMQWTRVLDAFGQPNVVTVTSDDGRKLVMNYTNVLPATYGIPLKRISSVVGPDGKSVQYTYDNTANANGSVINATFGNLIRVTMPDGEYRDYLYNEPPLISGSTKTSLLTGIVDEALVRLFNFQYNAAGEAIMTESPGGIDRHQFSYSESATTRAATIVDPIGTTRQIHSENILGIGLYSGQSQPGGAGCGAAADDVSYDTDGNALSRTDFNGNTQCFAYDTARRLETVRVEGLAPGVGCPSNLAAYSPTIWSGQRKVTRQWHPELSLIERRADPMRITDFVYNGRPDPSAGGAAASCAPAGALVNGQPIAVLCKRIEQATTDATGADGFSAVLAGAPRVSSWTYDAQGRTLTVDGPRTDVSDLTSYAYRAADDAACVSAPTICAYRRGDLWKTTNALGHVSEVLRYDGAGRVLSLRDANGVVTDLEYTPRGWLQRRIVRGPDAGGEADDAITVFEYEPYGSIKKVTQPDGSFLRYHYDAAHRLNAISDVAGDRIDYTLDAAGNRLKEETKDPSGNVKRLLARQYDALSRMRAQVNAPFAAMPNLDDPAVKKTRFEYDANGNSQLVTDALDVATDNDYDALNRLIRSIGDSGGINANSAFGYDARDNLRTVTDPKGLVTQYTYDGLDNLVQLSSPDTGLTNYTHDNAGNRVSQTDARRVTAIYGYDALNRLRSVSFPDTTLDLGFDYDSVPGSCDAGEQASIGRLSRFSDATGSTEFCYEPRGNLTRKTQQTGGVTLTVRYAWNVAGRLQSIIYPSGNTLRFERDAEGRVLRMFAAVAGNPEAELVSAVSYLPFGPVAGITWNNPNAVYARGVEGTPTSLQQTRSYDQNYWIDRIESSLAEGLQADFTLDVVGNITAIAGAGGAPVNGYSYDDLYRLTSESAPALSLAHAYDATGNRTAETVAGATTVYAYPPDSHRLTDIGGTERTFDAAGNLRVLNRSNRSSPEYAYDDRNRLAAYRDGGRDVATYAHNARGERVHKSAPKAGSATLFVYAEGGQLLGEYDADGNVLQEYAWLDALPVAVLKKSGPYPIEPDHLGTPRRAIAAELDRAVWAWDLQGPAFGTHAANDDPDADGQPFPLNLRFPGQYLDAESGLHYNYFRDYDPVTGRYVESDP